jgi:3-dehydroquinate synthase
LGYKNLVGNFYPPQDIYIDLAFINTLDDEMIVGGLFEAAKICYAKDITIFNQYADLQPSYAAPLQQMRTIIGLALSTKKWFIEVDEFDRKERLLLNFGHTFGHAIEAATNFDVHHGIGVGVGMLIATEYARRYGDLNKQGSVAVDRLVAHIKQMLFKDNSFSLGAPNKINLKLLLEKFDYDKKHKAHHYRMVIPQQDGSLALISVPKDDAEREKIKNSFAAGFDSINWVYHS